MSKKASLFRSQILTAAAELRATTPTITAAEIVKALDKRIMDDPAFHGSTPRHIAAFTLREVFSARAHPKTRETIYTIPTCLPNVSVDVPQGEAEPEVVEPPKRRTRSKKAE